LLLANGVSILGLKNSISIFRFLLCRS